MKKPCIILLTVLLLFSTLALFSCDQESVDSAQSDILDKASDMLEPFFKETEPSTGDSSDTATDAVDIEELFDNPPTSNSGTISGNVNIEDMLDQE